MLAFAVPIVPGKEDTWDAFANDLKGSKAGDFAAMNERHGLTQHSVWLQQTPDGNQMVVVVVDGPGADAFMGNIAQSQDATDVWFRDSIADAHGIDFSAPPPPAPVQRI